MVDAEAGDATRRSRLANERTYLAWLRTGFTALAVAVGAGKIVPSVTHVDRLAFEVVGAGFALLGVALTAYGMRRYLAVEEALSAGGFAAFGAKEAIGFAVAASVLGIAVFVLVFVR